MQTFAVSFAQILNNSMMVFLDDERLNVVLC